MENFSGKSKLTIEQDFFATVFTCNIASLLMQEAQDEMSPTEKQKKYQYKVNKNIGFALLKDELIKTILLNGDLGEFCRDVKQKMKKNMVPVRPGRSFPRHTSKLSKRKYPMNKRSGI